MKGPNPNAAAALLYRHRDFVTTGAEDSARQSRYNRAEAMGFESKEEELAIVTRGGSVRLWLAMPQAGI